MATIRYVNNVTGRLVEMMVDIELLEITLTVLITQGIVIQEIIRH